jgi:hypothetical protein
MSSSYSYTFSENIISNINSAKSGIYLTGSFNSITFENNIFKNIESTSSNGGVLLFNSILFNLILFYFYFILILFYFYFYFIFILFLFFFNFF